MLAAVRELKAIAYLLCPVPVWRSQVFERRFSRTKLTLALSREQEVNHRLGMGLGSAGGAGLGNLGLLEVPHTQTLDLGPGHQPPLLDPAHLDLEGLLRKHFNLTLKTLTIMQLPL